MRIRVVHLPGRREEVVEIPEAATGQDLLRAIRLPPDVHILARAETPIPLDEPLADGETIRVLSVVSGGLA